MDGKRKKAAVLLAEDILTDEEIAKAIGGSRSQLARWKKVPEFALLVNENRDKLAERALQHGVARREFRVGVLQDMHSELLKVVAERKADPTMQNVPGGKSGLLIKNMRSVGWGSESRVVEEYAIDKKLVDSLIALHERAAKELGQEVARSEVTGKVAFTIDVLNGILNEEHTYIDGQTKSLPDPR